MILVTSLLLGCGLEKEKPDLSADGKTFEAALRTPGDWTLIETIESAHPTAHEFERLWQVNGDPSAEEMLIEFTRFELESGYDYLLVADAGGAQLTENTGVRSGTELVVQGNSVELFLRTDESVARWGFAANVYQRNPATACRCATIHMPVCGVDGNTYPNPCSAGCASVQVAYHTECTGSPWTPLSAIVESPHNYADNYDNSWTISEGGSRFMRLHFSRIDVERGYDFVTVTDGGGNVVARYTGAAQDVLTPVIEGGSATVQLVSDGSIVRYGFAIDRYEVIGGCLTDRDCDNGQVCNTNIQCIRAPCFNACEAPIGTYAEVTVADLENNRSSWMGRQVSVVAEPFAFHACTRRGCSQADPCCNTCTATLMIGSTIALFDASEQAMGCRGNECNWQASCSPFAPQDAGEYQLRGLYTQDSAGQDRLVIHDFAAVACRATGCSSHVCANADAITTCEGRPEYACYASASCVAQSDGHCGWTQTPTLLACVDNARSQRFGSTDTPVPIPDNDLTGISSVLRVPTTGMATEALVSVDIAHSYRGDLIVRLIAPSGQIFTLHNGEGGSNRDLIFTDRAITMGVERNGQWTLHVVDRFARDTGTIDSWAISFR